MFLFSFLSNFKLISKSGLIILNLKNETLSLELLVVLKFPRVFQERLICSTLDDDLLGYKIQKTDQRVNYYR